MDAGKLKEKISGDTDASIRLLESLGYDEITTHGTELRFARLPGHNPSACMFDTNTLQFHCFSTGEHTDIIGLVMDRNGVPFKRAMAYIADTVGIRASDVGERSAPCKSDYYKKYKKLKSGHIDVETIDPINESAMSSFAGKYSAAFFRDGISFQTQRKFGIGMDLDNNRIAVPEYTGDGDLCGIMGRSNDRNCPKESRWLPIVSCKRSLLLYGHHFNYATIQKKQLCVIGESEKFVQQLDSFDCYVGLATCGCNISVEQARQLKSLMVGRLVVAYDEGLGEDQIRAEAEKLKVNYDGYKNKVGYIYDREHRVLRAGSKDAPSDCGREGFQELMRHCIVWL